MGDSRVPEWKLERAVLGELSAEELARVRDALREEPGGEARWQALVENTARTLEQRTPRQVAAEVLRRLEQNQAEPQHGRGLRWAVIAVPLMAAMGVMLVTRARSLGADPQAQVSELGTELDGDRVKGDSALVIHRLRKDGAVEQLASGAHAGQGDLLQLSVVPRAPGFAVVVSLDGRGTVTRHLPEEGDQPFAVTPGSAHALPSAYALDDAPAYERFVLVTSPTLFEVHTVLEAARRVGTSRTEPLPLPAGLQQRSVVVEKDAR